MTGMESFQTIGLCQAGSVNNTGILTFASYGTGADTSVIYATANTTNCAIQLTELTVASSGAFTVAGQLSVNGYTQTPEQIASWAVQQAEWDRQMAEQEKKARKVERVAARLLKKTVGTRQYSLYKKLGYFELIGQSGRRYRIRLHSRVQVMAENFGDKVEYEICIVHHQEHVPPTDRVITLILLLLSGEAGEKILHETGNRTAA